MDYQPRVGPLANHEASLDCWYTLHRQRDAHKHPDALARIVGIDQRTCLVRKHDCRGQRNPSQSHQKSCCSHHRSFAFLAYCRADTGKDTPRALLTSLASLHPEIQASQLAGGKGGPKLSKEKNFSTQSSKSQSTLQIASSLKVERKEFLCVNLEPHIVSKKCIGFQGKLMKAMNPITEAFSPLRKRAKKGSNCEKAAQMTSAFLQLPRMETKASRILATVATGRDLDFSP